LSQTDLAFKLSCLFKSFFSCLNIHKYTGICLNSGWCSVSIKTIICCDELVGCFALHTLALWYLHTLNVHGKTHIYVHTNILIICSLSGFISGHQEKVTE
jgi:hypothetical protein